MFSIGEYKICPGHGVGQIADIEEKILGNETKRFYIIRLLANGMTVMFPVDASKSVRDLVSIDQMEEVYNLLSETEIKIDTSTWNRRSREFTNKINTGNVNEIADVLRQLMRLKEKKVLSFGEKKMADYCRELLVQEFSLSLNSDKKIISDKINSYFH